MPRYSVEGNERIFYQTEEIEADTEEEARRIYLEHLRDGEIEETDSDDLDINAELIEEEEIKEEEDIKPPEADNGFKEEQDGYIGTYS